MLHAPASLDRLLCEVSAKYVKFTGQNKMQRSGRHVNDGCGPCIRLQLRQRLIRSEGRRGRRRCRGVKCPAVQPHRAQHAHQRGPAHLNGLIDRPLQRSAIPQMHLAQASSRPQRNHKYYRLDPSGLLTLDRFAVTWRSSSVPARRKVCRFTAAGAARVML